MGNVLLSARGTGDVKTKTNAETFGAATVVIADSVSDIRPNNSVTVSSGATIRAIGDLNVAAGTSIDFNRDQYTMDAKTDTFAGSAIPIDSVDSKTILFQTNTITVMGGSLLESAKDINLHAERLGLADLDSKAKAVNWMSAASDGLNSALGGEEQYNGSVQSDATGNVVVDGTLRTGIRRHQSLTLGAIDGDSIPYGWDRDTGAITTVSSTPGLSYDTGFVVLESGLMQQLGAARANLETYRTTNTTLRDFYLSEITRIQGQLVSKGLATIEADGSVTSVESSVLSINVHPIWAQAGMVDIRGDQFSGSGTIDAPADASVTITNHTPAQLNIQGVTIPESTGGLFVNGVKTGTNTAIAALNTPTPPVTVTFLALPPVELPLDGNGDPIGPNVNLENTFKSGDVPTDEYASPAILVSGDVTNYSGTVSAISKGDITYRASVRAANINTIAGGSVFIDGLTSYSVGGDPYGKLKALGNGMAQFDTAAALSKLTTASQTVNLMGDSVIVNAEYINVNGVVQSGKEQYSKTLDNGTTFEIALIRSNPSGTRFTRLSASDKDFTLFYDRVENKILVKEVRVSGGNVQLTGHILSTGAGTVRVLDGYGNISIDNQTPYDISIERLDSSQRGAGILLIADKAKGTSTNPLANILTQDGVYSPKANWRYGFAVGMQTATRTTTVYGSSSWAGIDALSADPSDIRSGPHVEVIGQPKLLPAGAYFYQSASADGDYTYSSQTNNLEPPRRYKTGQWSTKTWWGKKTNYQRWVDEVKQETVATHTFRADRPITIDFIGNATSSVNVTSNAGGDIIVAGSILNPSGTTTLTTAGSIIQTAQNESVGGTRVVLNAGAEIKGFRSNVKSTATGAGLFAEAVGAISIHQVSGTLPIESITSSGLKTVDVSAQNGLTSVDPAVTNITGGSIHLDGGAATIGAESKPLKINSGVSLGNTVSALSVQSIYLTEMTGDMLVDQIISENGDVQLTIVAGYLVDANNFATRDDRSYNELLSGVWSDLGLTAGTGANAKVTETLETFAASKTREYQTYWKWRNTQSDPATFDATYTISITGGERDTYESFYNAEGVAQDLSGTALDSYVQDAITTLENARTQQYRTLNATFAAYDRGGHDAGDLTQTQVTDFVYTLTTEENDALVASIKIWTEEELLNTIGAGLMKQVTDTQTTIELNNIIGRKVTITTADGGVGSFTDAISIDVTARPLQLTHDERVALAAAERTQVNFIAGAVVSGTMNFARDASGGDSITRTDGNSWIDDGYQVGLMLRIAGNTTNVTEGAMVEIISVTTNTLTVTHRDSSVDETGISATITPIANDPNAAGVVIRKIEIAQRDDVNIHASGDLRVIAAGPVFIGSENDFSVEYIETTGVLALKTAGGISNTHADQAVAMIKSDDLVLEAAQGAIGSATIPIRLNSILAASLTARALGGVYLFEQSGNINVDSVYSRSGAIVLTAIDGSILDNLGGSLNNLKSGLDITLSATEGSIGTSSAPLKTDHASAATISAISTSHGIYLWETFGDMRVGSIDAPNGDVSLRSHLSIIGTNGPTRDVRGNSVTLHADLGGIGAAGDELQIDSSYEADGLVTTTSMFGNTYVTELLGDLRLATTSTGSTATAFISALSGRIVNRLASVDDMNILSGNVYLFASQDIGEDARPITTTISNVEGKSTSGSTFLTNTGELIVGGVVSGSDPGMQSGGKVRLVAKSPVVVTEDIISATDILIVATEKEAAGDDITVADGVSIHSTGGTVRLQAGDDIRTGVGSSITAFQLLEIIGGFDNFGDVGSVIQIAGSLTAPFIWITGSDQDDNISLTDDAVTHGITVIQGAGGADMIASAATSTVNDPVMMYGDFVTVDYDTVNRIVSALHSLDAGIGGDDSLTQTGIGTAVMVGGAGADTISGLAGNDWAVGDAASVTIEGGKVVSIESTNTGVGGIDAINVGDGENIVIGGVGADSITAGNGINTIVGDEGQAVFDADGALLLAESTNPTIGDADLFDLGGGIYRVIAGAGDERIELGPGTNYVIGDAGRIQVMGDGTTQMTSIALETAGNDELIVSEGFNVLIGGSGADTITVEAGQSGSNDAIAIALGDNGSMTFTDAGVLLSIQSAEDDSYGQADTITLTSGTNTAIGGAGDDTITTGGGRNVVFGDDAQAVFRADGKLHTATTIHSGFGGADTIDLSSGENIVIAGVGADSIRTGDGLSTILSDEGRVEFDESGELLIAETINPTVGSTDVFDLGSGVYRVIAGAGDERIVLGPGTNYVIGDAGRIQAMGDGTVQMTSIAPEVAGNDELIAGEGLNVLIGGSGADTITVEAGQSGSNDAIAIALGDNGSMTFTDAGVLLSIQSADNDIYGQADTITLTSGTNTAIGGAGGDSITTGGGRNVVFGDDAEAFFYADGKLQNATTIHSGFGGADTLNLADGENIVIAGVDADDITAGDGTSTILSDEGRVEFDESGELLIAESIHPTVGSTDTFTLGSGIYRVIAGAGDERIVLGPGTNYVIGDAGRIQAIGDGTVQMTSTAPEVAGNDELIAGEGLNVLIGGSGADTITVEAGQSGSNDAIAIALGDNGSMTFTDAGVLLSIQSADNDIYGQADTITLTSGTNTAIGGAGGDSITTGGGRNVVFGDDAEAFFYADGKLQNATTIHSGFGGADTLNLADGENIVIAGVDADDITAGDGTSTILSDEGRVEFDESGELLIAETINPTVGSTDIFDLGSGIYRVIAGAGDERIVLGPGTNFVIGDAGRIQAMGDGTVQMTSTAPEVAGNDELIAGEGLNVLIGGSGADTITVEAGQSGSNDAIAIALGDNGSMTFTDAGVLLSIQSADNDIYGQADTITLTSGTNTAIGGAGGDSITTGGGRNVVFGDDAEAFFYADGKLQNATTIHSGFGGADTLNLADGENIVIAGVDADDITAGDGTSTILSDEGRVEFDESGELLIAESIHPTVGSTDTFTLGSGIYRVIAGAGDERIVLGPGTNFVIGDAGRIQAMGDGTVQMTSTAPEVAGNDELIAGEGLNVLIGGSGADTITVEAGQSGSNDAIAIALGDNGSMTFTDAGVLLSIQSADNDIYGQADTITLTSGTNTAIGGAGGDSITTGGGRNVVFGDDAEAFFYADGKLQNATTIHSGFGGADTLNLADGENIVIAGVDADDITAGDGTSTILSDEGRVEFEESGELLIAESIHPTVGSTDTFTLGSGIYRVIAGAGDERIVLGPGTNFVIGDAGRIQAMGDGTVQMTSIAPEVAGNDELIVSEGFNVLIGGSGADTITVQPSDLGETDSIAIALGDNGSMNFTDVGVLLSIQSAENDTYGSADTISLTSGTNTVIAGADDDRVTAGGGRNVVFGDDGEATFNPAGELKVARSIHPNFGGKDIISINDGVNVVIAGADEDQVNIADGLNTVLGDNGEVLVNHDAQTGGFLGRVIHTLAGNIGAADLIAVGSGNNVVMGGAGGDSISAGNGQNVIFGDNGEATFDSSDKLRMAASLDFAIGANDTIAVEDGLNVVIAGEGEDGVTVGGGHNTILGDNGEVLLDYDQLSGEMLSRIVRTLAGAIGASDVVRAGAGFNVVMGGAGGDTIESFMPQDAAPDAAPPIFIATGDNGEAFFDGRDRLLNLTTIDGEFGGDDTITTASADDVLVGGVGNDTITANQGNDIILGDTAKITWEVRDDVWTLIEVTALNEALNQAGDDTIHGNDGDDLVMGGPASDTIYGDSGFDVILNYQGTVTFPMSYTEAVSGWADQSQRRLLGKSLSLFELQNFITPMNGAGDVSSGDNSLFGGTGDDILFVTPGGEDQVSDESGYDTIDFQLAGRGVVFDVDKLNHSQYVNDPVNQTGTTVRINRNAPAPAPSPIENVITTMYQDVVYIAPLNVPRTVSMRGQDDAAASFPADEMRIHTFGSRVIDNGLSLIVEGLGTITHYGAETLEWMDASPLIFDDQSGAWTAQGGAVQQFPGAYQDDVFRGLSGPGSVAGWTVSGLTEGKYAVSMTWPDKGSSVVGSQVVKVNDGVGNLRHRDVFDQRSVPTSYQTDTTRWQDLTAPIYVDDFHIQLNTTGASNNVAYLTDAMRVERMRLNSPEIRMIDLGTGREVQDEYSFADLGDTIVGTNVTRTFRIENHGDQPLVLGTRETASPSPFRRIGGTLLDALQKPSLPNGFSSATFASSNVAPGDSTIMTVVFSPQSIGTFSGDLTIETNDVDEALFSFAVRGRSLSSVGKVITIDNNQRGFSVKSGPVTAGRFTQTKQSGAFRGNESRAASTGNHAATWTFEGLEPGNYRISASWTGSPANASHAAHYTLTTDGHSETAVMNQKVRPADRTESFVDLKTTWIDLSEDFVVNGDSLSVTLNNSPLGFVYADAIRIERYAMAPVAAPRMVVSEVGNHGVLENRHGVLDFGTTNLFGTVERSIEIVNRGRADLVFTDAPEIPAGFSLAAPIAFTSLAPGQSTVIHLRLRRQQCHGLDRHAPTVHQSTYRRGVRDRVGR